MASKFAADVTPNSDVLLATVAVDGTYLLNLCNRTTGSIKVRASVTTGSPPTTADYLEYDASVENNSPLARWPMPLKTGWTVYVRADKAGISAVLIGLEKA